MATLAILAVTVMSGSPLTLPEPPAHIHFLGIGGIGVSGLARMLQARGYRVTGSDMMRSPLTDALQQEGIQVAIGHAALNVIGAELVVTTAAAREDNPEIVAAKAARIPVVKRAAVLGLLARDARTLAVAGSHGKSTTSGMAAYALDQAGFAPSFAVGAEVRQLGTNARLGAGEHFVVEADEYDYSFLSLEPDVAIITNIEHDHPDLFPSFEDVAKAFEQFVERIRPGGALVINVDDPGNRVLIERASVPDGVRIVTFGERDGDWRLQGEVVTGAKGERTFELSLTVPGRHNRLNALALLAASGPIGVGLDAMLEGLRTFTGVGRRFEVLRDDPELTVVNDYAHHPTEIATTIAAARERYPERRILVIFQPHTYSRTRALLDEFAGALDLADETILAEIYPARERDTLGVSSTSIAERMSGEVHAGNDLDATVGLAAQQLRPGDVALVLGAGDIYRVAERLAVQS